MMFYENNDILSYEGAWKEGKKNGKGIEKMKNGKKYEAKYYKDLLIHKTFLGVEKIQ